MTMKMTQLSDIKLRASARFIHKTIATVLLTMLKMGLFCILGILNKGCEDNKPEKNRL